MRRRTVLAAPFAAAATASATAAQASFPNRPVTLVIPYPPGGGTDTIGRAVAASLERQLGQAVVVENRGGGATSIGSTAVAAARPDGYTLLLGSNSLAINPALQPTLTPRDPQRELLPVGPVYRSPLLLLVHPDLDVSDMAGFLDHVRRRPGALNYGSSGNGSANHLIAALLAQRAELDMVHVPYRGAAPALLDLRAGRVQVLFNSALLAQPMLRERSIRALAVSSRNRLRSMPELPAIAETLPGFDAVFWQGVFAPATTPPSVIATLSSALRRALAEPALQGRAEAEGGEIVAGTPLALASLLAEDMATWNTLIRAANLRVD